MKYSIILEQTTLQQKHDILALKECCPLDTLPLASSIHDTDLMMISQGGLLKKISMATLKDYFGQTPLDTVMFENEIVTFNGGAVLYTNPIPYNSVYFGNEPITYLDIYLTYN